MNNKLTPYNTGKVLIGVRYVVPDRAHDMDADAVLIQRALLHVRNPIETRIANFMNALKGLKNV